MNPRHRRLLIPGLLIALLVIVVVSSLARRADAAEPRPQQVSRITDPRITESSGLVMSRSTKDLAYTINDSGNAPILFAVRVSTGRVVGATTLAADLVDPEALSIDRYGTIWIADTGDNRATRTDVALYALPEPGEGDRTVTDLDRYPLVYPDGPRDVEALVINPKDNAKYLLTKGLFAGEVYKVPATLVTDRPNQVSGAVGSVAGMITDAAFAPDGAHVVARDYSDAFVLDAATWEQISTEPLPEVEQGETLAMERGGRTYLVGSEGTDSPLFRVPSNVPTSVSPAAVAAQTPASEISRPSDDGNGFAGQTWFWSALVLTLLAAISVAANQR